MGGFLLRKLHRGVEARYLVLRAPAPAPTPYSPTATTNLNLGGVIVNGNLGFRF